MSHNELYLLERKGEEAVQDFLNGEGEGFEDFDTQESSHDTASPEVIEEFLKHQKDSRNSLGDVLEKAA